MTEDVPPSNPPEPSDEDVDGRDFAPVLLRALTGMAARSQRRQADLIAALRGAGLTYDARQAQAALRHLQAGGLVTNLVPLSDGGLLLTLTPQAMERPGPLPQWLPLEELPPAKPRLDQAAQPAPADSGAARRNDEDLREYREIFDNASEGIYRSSIDGHQMRANPALVRLNGYETEEEMLSAVQDIGAEWYVEPGRREQFQRVLFEHGRVENFVSEIYRHRSRERIWISENAHLVRDGRSGEPLYFEGTVRQVAGNAAHEET